MPDSLVWIGLGNAPLEGAAGGIFALICVLAQASGRHNIKSRLRRVPTNTRSQFMQIPSAQFHRRAATAAILFALLCADRAVAAPAAGDSWAYRVVNRYNGEVRGNLQYRVDKVDA